MKTIGLIAGNGRFPVVAAQKAQEEGFRVVSCAVHDEADRAIEKVSSTTEWVKLGELGKVIRFFKKHGVEDALLAGKVSKASLFSGQVIPDFEMIKALTKVRDWRDDSLLRAVVNHLESKGIHILDSTTFLSSGLLESGVLTKRKPSRREGDDVEFGWEVAKEMGRLDIGQTVVIKDKAVLAVEAIEGTDEAIRRGGLIAKEGAVVVKVSKPAQDMRFDVPLVGLSTLQVVREVRASVLALEAAKTILLDKELMIAYADEHKISVVLR